MISCDGSCSNNQVKENLGGWAAVILQHTNTKDFSDGYTSVASKHPVMISGSVRNTTNQRMELTACIKALDYAKEIYTDQEVLVYTDSAYIVNCINDKWYAKWKRKGWITAIGTAVKNKDLWLELLDLLDAVPAKIIKVKGHSGDKYNELADTLAKAAIAEEIERS